VQLTLSATEFEVAWGALRLGDLPLLFRVRISRRGATEEERERLVTSTMDGLRRRGLADGRGLRTDLADALTVLARHRWAVDARLEFHREGRALGAATRSAAAIAMLDADTVTITSSTPYRLPADMAELAGDLPVRTGRSINLSAHVLFTAASRIGAGDPLELADELVALGVPAGDARTIAAINAEMLGGGQFGVQVVDQDGTVCRAPRVVGFCDTHDCRWAQLRAEDWITFVPAGSTQLAVMITDLLAECGVRAG